MNLPNAPPYSIPQGSITESYLMSSWSLKGAGPPAFPHESWWWRGHRKIRRSVVGQVWGMFHSLHVRYWWTMLASSDWCEIHLYCWMWTLTSISQKLQLCVMHAKHITIRRIFVQYGFSRLFLVSWQMAQGTADGNRIVCLGQSFWSWKVPTESLLIFLYV